jgi:hypothetical protein
MKKYYEGPEIEVRNYVLNPSESVLTASNDIDLEDRDTYNPLFG